MIVFIPLLPAFAGDMREGNAVWMQIQLHWEYMTICRGGGSLYEELEKDPNIDDPLDWIEFYSLRTHGKINGVPHTEKIYIHSKLMIVDDNIVILGSANINDRSMKGSRDSEIAMIIEDTDLVPSLMDGEEVMVGKFSHTLRVALYQEHLAMTATEVRDPLSMDF